MLTTQLIFLITRIITKSKRIPPATNYSLARELGCRLHDRDPKLIIRSPDIFNPESMGWGHSTNLDVKGIPSNEANMGPPPRAAKYLITLFCLNVVNASYMRNRILKFDIEVFRE